MENLKTGLPMDTQHPIWSESMGANAEMILS